MKFLPIQPKLPVYPDADRFHANVHRKRSGEVDFGVQWRDRTFSAFQLSWIVDTGELYLQDLREGIVAVIAIFEDRDQVESALTGWADACGGTGSIDWLMDRPWLGNGLPGLLGNNAGHSQAKDDEASKPRRSGLLIGDPSQILYS